MASYAKLKDGIFTRYRTYAEMVGALLVKDAQQRRVTPQRILIDAAGRCGIPRDANMAPPRTTYTCRWGAVGVPSACRWRAVGVLLACCWRACG